MIINQGNLGRLYTGFQTIFNQAVAEAKPMHERVATRVPSGTREEKYGWLGKIPSLREWVGDRVVQNIMLHDYAIKNKSYEVTIGVDRDDISDDQVGVYNPLFAELGLSSASHPSQLVYGLLASGFATVCYDGQFFFDTDHPVIAEDGSVVSVSNTGGGGGTAWFLLDTTRAVKAIIWQERQSYRLVRMDREDDEAVFSRKEFRYGVDGRGNVGFGLWQLAYGSKQTLNAANYAAARAAIQGVKGDHGRPIGGRPNLLVVPPALEGNGLEILNAERDAAGATNVWKGTAELLVVPWLA